MVITSGLSEYVEISITPTVRNDLQTTYSHFKSRGCIYIKINYPEKVNGLEVMTRTFRLERDFPMLANCCPFWDCYSEWSLYYDVFFLNKG